MQGKFAFVMVTTLERLLLNSNMTGAGPRAGAMQLLVIERNLVSILGALFAAVRGRLGLQPDPRRPPRARRRDPDRRAPLERHPRRRDVRGQ